MQELRVIRRTDQSSDPDTENAPSEAPAPRRLLRLCAALVMIICAGWLLIESMRSDSQPDLSPSAVTPVDSSQQPRSATKAIKDIQVGERVLAENPELHQAQQTDYREPDWSQWLQLSLVMLNEDGSELNIELLRSEGWVRSQLVPIHAPFADQTASNDSPQQVELISEDASLNPGDVPGVPLSPLRLVFRELVFQQVMLEAVDRELIGMAVEMDLPELAITGSALLVDMQVAPLIKVGQGRVVTATFQHTNADVIDLTIGDAVERETIGTTSNHPFWSEDRQAFVQAGTLKSGERVRTYLGDHKQVISLRARPGPQEVYNLEVHAEHVYYVGEFGTLVHNAAGYNVDAPSGASLGFDATHRATAAYQRRGKAYLQRLQSRGITNETDATRIRALSILQRISNRQNRILQRNPDLLDDLLSDNQLRAIEDKGDWLKNMFYGSVLEKQMVARRIQRSPTLSSLYEHVGDLAGPNGMRVDFEGRGLFQGLEFDLTTELQFLTKLRKYGSEVLVPTYRR
ncbi:hypothetical protein SV7mr_20960 [Stieleria bergensis]|uniref:Intein C-terminal splicing domain-containing protein n=2 Tax=Stieleria bergensis TaxID=2528025 RepID=A0A517STY2_9BACT|nr:hypothetical protein SV7mr_20960 [Planctomycetes bacterium SV_7m_r]